MNTQQPRRHGAKHLSAQTLLCCALVLSALIPANAQWTVRNLHVGAGDSFLYGVDAENQVGQAVIGGGDRAVLWSGFANTSVVLDPGVVAYGAGDGQQVGYVTQGTYHHASLWTGSAKSWVDLHPAQAQAHSGAFDADAGQQVGWAWRNGYYRASLWSGTSASWVDLAPIGYEHSSANAIDDGVQVGWAILEGLSHAGSWTGNSTSWIDLHPKSASVSAAYDVHDHQVAGVVSAGRYRASLWKDATASSSWVDLSRPGSTYSYAYGIYRDQQVGFDEVGGQNHAAIWNSSSHSWLDLHDFLPGEFQSSVAERISEHDGKTYIVGYGRPSFRSQEALMWIAEYERPAEVNVVRGNLIAGNLQSLLYCDDDRLVVRPGVVLSSSDYPIQIVARAHAPMPSPTSFAFTIESSASSGNVYQKVWLYDFVAGSFVGIDENSMSTTDNTLYLIIDETPYRYVQPVSHSIVAKIEYKAFRPVLAYPWTARVDHLKWVFPG